MPLPFRKRIWLLKVLLPLPPVLHLHRSQELPPAQLGQKGVSSGINAHYSASDKFHWVSSNSWQRQAFTNQHTLTWADSENSSVVPIYGAMGRALISGNAYSRWLASLACRARSGRGCLLAASKIMTVFWGYSHVVIVEMALWHLKTSIPTCKLEITLFLVQRRCQNKSSGHSSYVSVQRQQVSKCW